MLDISNTHSTLALDERAVEAVVRRVLEGEALTLESLSIVLAGHELVLDLNRTWLAHDYTTDVLSFSLTEEPGLVEGEVYVDLDTAQERHLEFDTSFEREALRYVVHGVLHLAGYDDGTPDAKATMHALEDRYLGSAGL